MKQSILNQLVKDVPEVRHYHLTKIKEIEAMYSALINIDQSIGDIEVEKNSSVNEIYRILEKEFNDRKISISYDSYKDKILKFNYHLVIDQEDHFYMSNTYLLNFIAGLPEYKILLCCIYLLSKTRYCIFFYFEMYMEYIEECLLYYEFDKEEILHFEKEREILCSIEQVTQDFLCLTENKARLRIKRALRNREKYKKDVIKIAEKTIIIFEKIQKIEKKWLPFDHDEGYVPSNYFIGFGCEEFYQTYNEFNDYMQNGFITNYIPFEKESICLLDDFLLTESYINDIIYSIDFIIEDLYKKNKNENS